MQDNFCVKNVHKIFVKFTPSLIFVDRTSVKSEDPLSSSKCVCDFQHFYKELTLGVESHLGVQKGGLG